MDNAISIAITPFVLGATQLVKKYTKIPNKLSPFVSLFFGLLFAYSYTLYCNNFNFQALDNLDTIISSFIAGLTASGLFSGIKAGSEYINQDDTIIDDTQEN